MTSPLHTVPAFEAAQAELAYAYDRQPFFRQHLEGAGVSPRQLADPESFARGPTTAKHDFRKNFPIGVMARGFRLADPRLHRTQSSGTTGERLTTVELGGIFLQRALTTLSVHPQVAAPFFEVPRRHCQYAPPRCSNVECANPRSGFEDRLLPDGTLVLSVEHDLYTTPDRTVMQNLAELERHRPALFFADPTHLAFLARRCRAQGRALPAIATISSYSMSTQIARRSIRGGMAGPAPIADVVAMSELGFVAAQCPHGRLHLNNESFYPELVDENLPAGLAELVVTTCHQGCTPRIRYRTGDLYRADPHPCPCGHRFPVVEYHGRRNQMIVSDGQLLATPREIDDAVGDVSRLQLYRLEQRSDRELCLLYVADDSWQDSDHGALLERVASRLSPAASLSCERRPFLPTTAGGKFQSCFSSVSQRALAV